MDTLREHFPLELLPLVIHESTRHGEAFSAQLPVSWHDPGGVGDTEYRQVVSELLGVRAVAV
jgi:hypothetical protein